MTSSFLRAAARCLVFVAALFFVVFAPRRADAYAWMIRHETTGCATCHVDPSGGGLLTPFGRTQASAQLETQWGEPKPDSRADDFLFGAVTPPDWLTLGGSLRGLGMIQKEDGASSSSSFVLMQADLRGAIAVGGFRAYGSIGGLTNGNSPAAVFSAPEGGSLVSREHWIGWSFLDDRLLVRAGRITLPFGIRSIEHNLFVRAATRTDLNDTQQHGLSVAWAGDVVRGEIMGIAGNYQTSPDDFRERGYSGFVEAAIGSRAAVGASSLWMHANEDVLLRVATTRQAHGGFVRASPWEPIVVLAEVDYVGTAPSGLSRFDGLATMLQLDVEPWQGLHLIGTGETLSTGAPGADRSWGLWGGLAWFFLPHVDFRLDFLHRSQSVGAAQIPLDAYLLQGHFSL